MSVAAVQAWNLMGGAIVWEALPVVTEMLGVDDVEVLIHLLTRIRDR